MTCKGYRYAEESPDLYHGVAPFIIENGVGGGPGHNGSCEKCEPRSFSDAFGRHLACLARRNPRICAISAAMTAGTGLTEFSEKFPARFFDGGIAEQHAMTMAAGMAAGGLIPVVALYSTFFQRAYDQLLHDICLQRLPMVLAIDRAGIVGEDGETHQGIYDLSLLLPLPGLEIYCPPDYASLRGVLEYAVGAKRPVVIRYPRGREWPQVLPLSAAERWQGIRCLRPGSQVTIASLGIMAGPALQAAELLSARGIEAEVLLIVCAKPLDLETLIASVRRTGHLLFVEESLVSGGLGQKTLPDLMHALPGTPFCLHGISEQPICQGSREQLLAVWRLNPEAIAEQAWLLLHPQKSNPISADN